MRRVLAFGWALQSVDKTMENTMVPLSVVSELTQSENSTHDSDEKMDVAREPSRQVIISVEPVTFAS